MRVEVEVSELPSWCYYIDAKCNELEAGLNKHSKYHEYAVRREHLEEDWMDDPYVILEPTSGEEVLSLEPHEIESLTLDEIILLMEYHAETTVTIPLEDAAPHLLGIGLGAIGVSSALLATQIFVGNLDPMAVLFFQFSVLLMIVYAMLRHRWNKIRNDRQRQLICDYITRHSQFLDVLRRLVALPDVSDWTRRRYKRILRTIEKAMQTLCG